jgi:hypothetical protein
MGSLDQLNDVTLEKSFVGVPLRFGQLAEDYSISLLRQLMCNETFHPAKKELR